MLTQCDAGGDPHEGGNGPVSSTNSHFEIDATGDVPPPSPAAVREALEHILGSKDFVASDRARRFLRYIVEERLGGRSERIKAYSIAIEVFGRDQSFDAQNDPVVRIEAGRLRRALEHYYILAGRKDSITIEIPKGAYVPVFGTAPAMLQAEAPVPSSPQAIDVPVPPIARQRPPWIVASGAALLAVIGTVVWYAAGIPVMGEQQTTEVPGGPSVLVMPFADLGDGATSALYSAALTDEIVTALARFKEITVLGVQSSRSVQSGEAVSRLHSDLGVNYVLEGSVRAEAESGRVLVNGRLLNAPDGAVLWSRQFNSPLTAANLLAIQADTAQEVATAIAQPYGIVFQTESVRAPSKPPDNLEAYLCTLRYYRYRPNPSAESHLAVRDCLERAVTLFPNYATAWALLAHVYLDEARHGLNRRAGDPNGYLRALDASRGAFSLDPENPRALQSLATALFYNRQVDEAFEVGEKAIALTPNDAELLGQIGQLYGLAGRFDEGRAMLENALKRNPAQSGFYWGTLALIAYMQSDYDTALAEIVRSDVRQLPIYHAIAAIIYAQKKLDQKARAEAEEFQRLSPDFVPNLWAELDSRNIPIESQLHIADGLRKAGLAVPPRKIAADRVPTQ